jgi:pimeloyl-ACP methyl ester carboxylesterase
MLSKSSNSGRESGHQALSSLRQIAAVVLVFCWLPVTSALAGVGGAEQLSQPGKLVDIGTHRLHIFCVGSGQPTVVIDSGLGGNSLEWIRVQRSLAPHVQVCSYDRAGYGWSEPGPRPRTSSRIVDELFALLKKADVAGPYVLVGHSFGGYTMQLFANRYPDQTAGLVLVDSSHPEQFERFLAPPIKVNLAPSGRNRIMMLSPAPPLHKNLPEEVRHTVQALNLRAETRAAMGDELLDFRLSAKQVRNARELPNVPLVVLTRGKRVWPLTDRGQHMERLWAQLQVELASGVQQVTHIIAAGSGHHIHLDQPELVANSVNMVVDLVRSSAVFVASDPRALPAI